jgi:hypothetical protein
VEYLDWNMSLANHFFSSEKAARKVYLYATKELIEKIGRPSGEGFDAFVQKVLQGPDWVHRAGFCQRVLEAMNGWRSRNLPYPPYIAFLSLFVIAAGLEGEFEPHSYYPRLWKVLGEDPRSGTPPSFDKMLRVWDDLETWSTVDKRGELGVFQVTIIGGWIHVGVPLSQTLLSEEDRHALPLLFARAALDPTAPPAAREIEAILRNYGRELLRAKTLRILAAADKDQSDAKQALIQSVIDELRNWNGIALDKERGGIEEEMANWPLRLCCDLDKTARTAVMSLRCKAPGEFPEEAFTLSFATKSENISEQNSTATTLICEEWQFGWSTPIQHESGELLDAAGLDWTSGITLQDRTGHWRFRLAAAVVRVFVDGNADGIGSLVEIFRLPAETQFYVAASPPTCAAVSNWGECSCDGWSEVGILKGLPDGWRLFSADRARSDNLIRADYPVLSLPSYVSVTLHGGIRVSRGYRYFRFAPPLIEVQGPVDDISFNGVSASRRSADGAYEIPPNLPALQEEDPDKIRIEATRDGNVVDRMSIFLSQEGWSWVDRELGLKIDTFGEAIEGESTSFVRGGTFSGFDVAAFDYEGAIPLAADGAVHYIGRKPGQIIHWPYEAISTWSPVWVIVSRRSGEVIFCGADISDCEPAQASCNDRGRLKQWKEFIWVRRKLLALPNNRTVRALWRRYQEMAKHV